jgi:hypothetical protein
VALARRLTGSNLLLCFFVRIRILDLCVSGSRLFSTAGWALGLKRSTRFRQAGKAARRFHHIFEMGDVIIDPGKISWFAFHSTRVLGKSIAYKSGSDNNIRAFHFLVLWYKVCTASRAVENRLARCFPAGMSVLRE